MQQIDVNSVQVAIGRARTAVATAKMTRDEHRYKSFKRGLERWQALEKQDKACGLAAKSIRRYIGMLPSHPELAPLDEKLRGVSAELTYQRRQMRKMLR